MTNLRRLVPSALFVAALASAPTRAWSAPRGGAASPSTAAPSEEARRAAAEHYQKGLSFLKFGAYDDAIREYRAAYALAPRAELLFNIAQAYRTKGDRRHALEHYQRYLEVEPTGQGADFARAHVLGLQAELRAEDEARQRRELEQRQASEHARLQDEARARAGLEAARGAAEEATLRRVAEEEARRRAATGRTLRISGVVSAGVGLAAVALGVKFALDARDLSRGAVESEGDWTDELEAEYDDAEAAQRNMFLLYGLGGAAVITGGVLYGLGVREARSAGAAGERRALRVVPLASGSVAGLALGGTY